MSEPGRIEVALWRALLWGPLLGLRWLLSPSYRVWERAARRQER